MVGKAKEGILSPLPTVRQVFSHLKESRALPSHILVTCGGRHHHCECILSALYAEHDALWYGMPLC